MKFIEPNWTRSNLNISSTLAEFLGAPNKNATLPILKEELTKGYKNIVFICFDGLGINPIEKNLDANNILRKNIKQTLVSTFPSTTTNATTSLLTNKLPLEHGWFGWSLHFKELNRNVDIFLNRDSWTGEEVEIKKSPLGELDYYFDNSNSDYQINTVFPEYVKVKYTERNNVFNSKEQFFNHIKNICNKNGKQFVYAYYYDPDATMHDYGVTSNEAKEVINSISKNVENLLSETNDTLFIITADHGQIDVEGYLDFCEDDELLNYLKIYPYLDSRTPCFIVKDGKNNEFEEFFTKKYGNDLILYKSQDLIEKGYFGEFGDKGHLLGDYIAIGTYTHKMARMTQKSPHFKGHHTSLTEEMEVPLILINNKRDNVKAIKAGCYLIDVESQKIALVYREKQKDYTFPKGHLEGSESIKECAERETAEETKRVAKIIDEIEPTVEKYISLNGENCECYMFVAIDNGASDNSSTDTHDVHWINFEEVEDKLTYESLKNIWKTIKDKIKTLFNL